MKWNCAHCSSQCLREMEDSICVFVKDFSHVPFLREEARAYWRKYKKLPTLRFCLPEGRYLMVRQVGPLFAIKTPPFAIVPAGWQFPAF